MKNWLCAALGLLGAMVAPITCAHEFWMLPKSFAVASGGATALTLAVGENAQGDPVAFSAALVVSLRHYSLGQSLDLRGRVPADRALAELPVVLPRAGTHLIALDTNPSQIVLPADKFHAYLHDEGLDFVIKKREAAGTATSPGRERYRRNLKTLLQAGGVSDATYSVRTGQRLEIVPLANPSDPSGAEGLGLQILFDGKPLANALVKAWQKRGGQTLIIRTRTDTQGNAAVTFPWPGAWMLSVVHMVAVTDSEDHDWDSYWANLTFALPGAAP